MSNINNLSKTNSDLKMDQKTSKNLLKSILSEDYDQVINDLLGNDNNLKLKTGLFNPKVKKLIYSYYETPSYTLYVLPNQNNIFMGSEFYMSPHEFRRLASEPFKLFPPIIKEITTKNQTHVLFLLKRYDKIQEIFACVETNNDAKQFMYQTMNNLLSKYKFLSDAGMALDTSITLDNVEVADDQLYIKPSGVVTYALKASRDYNIGNLPDPFYEA